jgi:hypothetical protein
MRIYNDRFNDRIHRGRITIRFRRPLLPPWIVVAAGIAATGSLLYAIMWIVFAAF